jgi:hypothetical protein
MNNKPFLTHNEDDSITANGTSLQAYLHNLFTNGDKVYVFRFLRLVLHCC